MALSNNPTPNELVKAVKDVEHDKEFLPLLNKTEYKAFAFIDQIATTGQSYILPTGISKFECSRLNDANITVGDKILVFAKIYTTDSSYSGYNYVRHRIYLSTITSISTYGYDVSSELYGIGGNIGNDYYRNIALKNEIPDISDVVTHDDTVTTESETTFADNYYTKTQIVDLIYPIGSVFITVNNVNPSTYLPNTNWELLEDRFLLGAGSTYTAGATGGEATHTLTIDEMPSHYHRLLTVNTWSSNAVGLKDTLNSTGSYNTRGIAGVEQTSGDTRYVTRSSSNQNYVENTGGGQPHNNMPPYLVVYMWKRIPLANS